MKLLIFISSGSHQGVEVAQAWQEANAPGVTLIPAQGLYTLQEQAKRGAVELPRMITSMSAALAYILERSRKMGQIALTVAPDDQAQALIDAAQEVTGDLNTPDSGIIFVVDVEQAVGVNEPGKRKNNKS